MVFKVLKMRRFLVSFFFVSLVSVLFSVSSFAADFPVVTYVGNISSVSDSPDIVYILNAVKYNPEKVNYNAYYQPDFSISHDNDGAGYYWETDYNGFINESYDYLQKVHYSLTFYGYGYDYVLNTSRLAVFLGNNDTQIINIDNVTTSQNFFLAGNYPINLQGRRINFDFNKPFNMNTPDVHNQNICIPANSPFSIDFDVTYFHAGKAYFDVGINFGSYPVTTDSYSYLGIIQYGDLIDFGDSSVVNSINNQNQIINQQTQQQQQQYDDFTNSGSSSEVDSISADISSKVGIFDAVDSIGTGFYNVWQSTSNSPELVFPAFSMRIDGVQYNLWDSYRFNFDEKFEEWGLNNIKTVLNFIMVFLVYGALLRYLQYLYDRIFGGK